MNRRQETLRAFDERIYPVLVGQIYARANIGIVATIVNAAIFVAVLWEQISHRRLIVWLTALLLVSFIRFLLNRRFLTAPDTKEAIRGWGQLLILGLGIAGMLWGASGLFLFPLYSVAHQVFIAFVLAGMVAGAVGVFSPLLPVFLSFSIPALVPIAIRFFAIGDTLHMGMGAMTTLFGILTYTTARRINAANKELIALKEAFADRLEERTAELEATNGQLRREIEERKQLITELQAAIAKIRTLSGLLPICSACKKIRDDKGYWNQIEAYIEEHSDAAFSHGICPECFRRIYPDMDGPEE
jgi:two-component system, cell cycle sensor histidine kinase and response regulator CckA